MVAFWEDEEARWFSYSKMASFSDRETWTSRRMTASLFSRLPSSPVPRLIDVGNVYVFVMTISIMLQSIGYSFQPIRPIVFGLYAERTYM